MHSLTRALLFLLPLTAAPFALAQSENHGAKRGLSDVKNFFTGNDPVELASKLPACILGCVSGTEQRGSTCTSTRANVFLCLCAEDDGKLWQEDVVACNKNETRAPIACSDDAMGDVRFDSMCKGLKEDPEKLNATSEAMADALGPHLAAAKIAYKNLGVDKGNGTAASGAAGPGAVGMTAFGALAVVFGFAVALL
jgi:hypothetical protein